MVPGGFSCSAHGKDEWGAAQETVFVTPRNVRCIAPFLSAFRHEQHPGFVDNFDPHALVRRDGVRWITPATWRYVYDVVVAVLTGGLLFGGVAWWAHTRVPHSGHS